MHDDEIDELFGPAIEYEQPSRIDDSEDLKYRKIHMVNWMAAGGLCDCGTPMEFEDYYQHGQCLECLQKEMASNIEEPFM